MLTIYDTKKLFESTECTTAVLPVGAVEQHGNHLPVGTDTILANEIAKRLAEGLQAWLLPVISITSSIEHRRGKGTIYIKEDTLSSIIRDIAESLHFSGYKKLVVFNGHGGNWILKPAIRRINRELQEFQVILLHTSIAIQKHRGIFTHIEHDLHAGEFETSLMLFLFPEYVKQITKQHDPEFFSQSFIDYFDVTDLTQHGYWGFPEEATSEKGRQAMDLIVQHGLQYIRDVDMATAKLKTKMN